MDPKECLRLADQAISDLHFDEARAHLSDYATWRANGGFEPIEVAGTLMRGDAFARYVRNRIPDAPHIFSPHPPEARHDADR